MKFIKLYKLTPFKSMFYGQNILWYMKKLREIIQISKQDGPIGFNIGLFMLNYAYLDKWGIK